MCFLYAAAWQDYKSGAVDLLLLIVSFVLTAFLGVVAMFANGWMGTGLIPHVLAMVIVAVPLIVLVVLKRMGGADAIIFTQITLLFGICVFSAVITLASVAALAWTIAAQLADPVKRRGLSLNQLQKQEIRFIPFVALAAQVVLVASYLLV